MSKQKRAKARLALAKVQGIRVKIRYSTRSGRWRAVCSVEGGPYTLMRYDGETERPDGHVVELKSPRAVMQFLRDRLWSNDGYVFDPMVIVSIERAP